LRAQHRRAADSAIWMNDPHDNGGLTAENAEQALNAVSEVLSNPESCQEKARAWLAAHVSDPPESASARFEQELERLAETS
jgi:hypothetical protein